MERKQQSEPFTPSRRMQRSYFTSKQGQSFCTPGRSMPYDAVGIADVGEAKDFTQMQDDTSRERRMVFTGKTYRLTLTRRMILLE